EEEMLRIGQTPIGGRDSDVVHIVGAGVGRVLEVGSGNKGEDASARVDREFCSVGAADRVRNACNAIGIDGVDVGHSRRVLGNRDGNKNSAAVGCYVGSLIDVGYRDTQ